jgi:hypothetical protein
MSIEEMCATQTSLPLIEGVAKKIGMIRERIYCPPKCPPLRCFTFQKYGYTWQGVLFEDGYICIRGRSAKGDAVTCQYSDLEEMMRIRSLKQADIHWMENE